MNGSDLWARFDVKDDLNMGPKYADSLGNYFHWLPLDIHSNQFGEVEVECVSGDVDVSCMQEASRNIEQRKKCPRCYEAWIQARANRQHRRDKKRRQQRSTK